MKISNDPWADVDQHANLFNLISSLGNQAHKDPVLEAVSQLPFDQRVAFFWNDQSYLKHLETFEKNFSTLLQKGLLRIIMPEITEDNKVIYHEINIDYNDKEQIRRYAVRIFFKDFFWHEQSGIANKFFDPEGVFSTDEHKVMSMFVTSLKNQPESILTAFKPQDESENDESRLNLTHFLKKDLIDCANTLGRGISKDAETVLKYAIHAMEIVQAEESQNPSSAKIAKLESVKAKIDVWVSEWLNSAQLSEKNIQNLLMDYLAQTSDTSVNTFNVVLAHVHKMPKELQEKAWNILFNKINRNPDLINEVSPHIQQLFNNQSTFSDVAVFYNQFSTLLPTEIRAKILGNFSPKAQKKYWNILFPTENREKLIEEKIQTANGETFLAWHLLQQGDLSPEQMIKILEKLDSTKHFNFFFAIKRSLNEDVFTKIADRFVTSSADWWRWVSSFQKTPDFEKRLAQIYPRFSDRIRGNKDFVKLLNKNCDLVYHLACDGNTSALSQVKKKLQADDKKSQADDFWKALIQEHEDHTSGLSALCHSGKRGLFDLIEDLPVKRQRELFQKENSQGKSALDECRGEFLQMVQEKVFDQENATVVQQPQQVVIPTEQPQQPASVQKSDKALYPRQKMLLRGALKELTDIQKTNDSLYNDVQGFIDSLVTMSGTRLRDTLQNDSETRGPFANNPIGVHNVHNYHVGYKVAGDADKNEGKFVVLFVWSHEQWQKDLWNAGPALAEKANKMIRTAPQHPNAGKGAGSR